MSSSFNLLRHRLTTILSCATFLAASLVLLLLQGMAFAQGTFSSGSTGADGAFNPSANIQVQLPESGVFNYTTVNIPAGVIVTYLKNSKNTPVTILGTGNVAIAGTINIDGAQPLSSNFGGEGGPGGFRGGDGGSALTNLAAKPGDGPGGGGGGKGGAYTGGGGGGYFVPGQDGRCLNSGAGGAKYGTATLLPLIGGSGGGGDGAAPNEIRIGGGGGGGAILIASSTSISFTSSSQILARGGSSTNSNGATGSGGSIRAVANVISGTPILRVDGGAIYNPNSTCGGLGSAGIVRVEAFDLTGFNPISSSPQITLAQPNPVTLPNNPQLIISSVGGVNAPANPKGSFYQQPDIVVPTNVSNPVTVNLQATNLPVGTVLQVMLTNEAGAKTTVNSTPLAGTQATSTATASITLPTTGIAVISATVTLNVLLAYGKPMHINGKRIDKVEIGTSFGCESLVTYITDKGERLKWPSE